MATIRLCAALMSFIGYGQAEIASTFSIGMLLDETSETVGIPGILETTASGLSRQEDFRIDTILYRGEQCQTSGSNYVGFFIVSFSCELRGFLPCLSALLANNRSQAPILLVMGYPCRGKSSKILASSWLETSMQPSVQTFPFYDIPGFLANRFPVEEVKGSCLLSNDASSFLEYSTDFHLPERAEERYLVEIGKDLLRNTSLSYTATHRPPVVFITNDTGGLPNAYGFVIEMISTIVANAGAKLQTRPKLPYDGTFGSAINKTTWNGMVGMIMRREVDIGAAGFTMTAGRASVIDFTIPFYIEPTSIMVPPPSLDSKLFAVLKPLSFRIWAVSCGVTGFIAVLLWAAQTALGKSARYKANSDNFRLDQRRFQPFLYSYAGFLSIGLREPRQSWLRMGAAMVQIIALLIGAVYNSALIAALSIPTMLPAIETLEQLANQKQVLWTIQRGTSHQDLFQNSVQGVYQKIGELLLRRPDVMVASNQEGVEKVLTGKFAFIKEKSLLDFAVAQDERATEQCRLYVAREEFFLAGQAVVLRKGAPYMHYFNHQIQWMIQTGLTEHWKRKYFAPKNRCSERKASSVEPSALDVDDTQGAFLFLGCGVFASAVAFVAEILYKSWTDRQLKKATIWVK